MSDPAASSPIPRVAVLTSGGDAQGMNAAVRAVVRGGLSLGAGVVLVREGYRGLVEGGAMLEDATWDAVGGILQAGGTVIGTARCPEFAERDGRRRAVANLLAVGVDRLVVIGGDGSLTGASVLWEEWPALVDELVSEGAVTPEVAAAHPSLRLVGVVGSIDNDLAGLDSTIGADSALHRIVEAIDAITSTAASHQRAFVVEVMGRRCGELAVRGALAGSADWVFIPEDPPEPGWQERLGAALREGRANGQRDSIVVLAEGAVDATGERITADAVRDAIKEGLHEDVRVTVLGHVQRGGVPSAFDRLMGTIVGETAIRDVLDADRGEQPEIVGVRNNRVTRLPLMEAIAETRAIGAALEAGDHATVRAGRGDAFGSILELGRDINRPAPRVDGADARRRTIAILHAGGLAPGMNAGARAVTRFALDRGHRVVGVRDGFRGLVAGDLVDLDWMDVSGWGTSGGAELGVARLRLSDDDVAAIAATLRERGVDAIVMVGGWSGYTACHDLWRARDAHPELRIPIVAVPASINNNLPGTELSIGADTALNTIVEALDRIKQSAVAAERCFVVEVMGHHCGYLALMAGLVSGAECVFLPETGVTLDDLQRELGHMVEAFSSGTRMELVIRSEGSSPVYSTDFMARIFEEEGGSLFTVRTSVLGHIQQGGNPSPLDRVMAARMAAEALRYVDAEPDDPQAVFVGVHEGRLRATAFERFAPLVDAANQRPQRQWWLGLHDVAERLAHRPAAASGAGASAARVRRPADPAERYHTQEET